MVQQHMGTNVLLVSLIITKSKSKGTAEITGDLQGISSMVKGAAGVCCCPSLLCPSLPGVLGLSPFILGYTENNGRGQEVNSEPGVGQKG